MRELGELGVGSCGAPAHGEEALPRIVAKRLSQLLIALAVVTWSLAHHRSTFPYNTEGRYFDPVEEVVYLGQSVFGSVAVGTVAFVVAFTI